MDAILLLQLMLYCCHGQPLTQHNFVPQIEGSQNNLFLTTALLVIVKPDGRSLSGEIPLIILMGAAIVIRWWNKLTKYGSVVHLKQSYVQIVHHCSDCIL